MGKEDKQRLSMSRTSKEIQSDMMRAIRIKNREPRAARPHCSDAGRNGRWCGHSANSPGTRRNIPHPPEHAPRRPSRIPGHCHRAEAHPSGARLGHALASLAPEEPPSPVSHQHIFLKDLSKITVLNNPSIFPQLFRGVHGRWMGQDFSRLAMLNSESLRDRITENWSIACRNPGGRCQTGGTQAEGLQLS